MTSSPDALVTAAGLPDFLVPWADRFYEPFELDLAEALAAGPLPEAELLRRIPDLTTVGLARAARRGVVDLAGDGEQVCLADFHTRFEIWAMFEGWRDVPDDVAARLNAWELAHYEDGLAADLGIGPDGLITADSGSSRDAAYSYILLDEAEDIVCSVPHVYQWPCDCRAMFGRCRKPVNVCLRFDNDRGLGWEISAERAVSLLRQADRAGLMRTAVVGTEGEAGAICNCCTDCCFPHQASRRLGIAEQWPRRRYIAAVDAAACTLCGRCVKRCPFEAFSLPEPTGTPRGLLFAADRCRGCGLCATGCRDGAISMGPRVPQKT